MSNLQALAAGGERQRTPKCGEESTLFGSVGDYLHLGLDIWNWKTTTHESTSTIVEIISINVHLGS